MLIAQISDLHLKRQGTRLFGAVDTYARAAAAIGRIERLRPRPDALVITGDLVNDGDAADHAALEELLGRLSMPVFPILGNHDARAPARRALERFGDFPADGPFRYAAAVGPLRLVALDSLVEGEAHGLLGPDQIDWLARTLAAAPGTPTLVLVHHPPFATGIGFMDDIGLKDADAFAAVIAGFGQVERVLSGHVHRAIEARFAGTIAMTVPGTAHQVVCDLAPEAPAAWIAEPPAFALHRWDGARIVSHLVYVEDFGPPESFSDQHTT